MITVPSDVKIYLALGATDMRKSINGLSIIASEQMKLDIFSGHLFVFCNRSKTILKILYWDRNGFCIWQKRLEKDRFKWPVTHKEVMHIGKWKQRDKNQPKSTVKNQPSLMTGTPVRVRLKPDSKGRVFRPG
jgi:transposase